MSSVSSAPPFVFVSLSKYLPNCTFVCRAMCLSCYLSSSPKLLKSSNHSTNADNKQGDSVRTDTPVVLRVFGQLIIFTALSLCTSRDNNVHKWHVLLWNALILIIMVVLQLLLLPLLLLLNQGFMFMFVLYVYDYYLGLCEMRNREMFIIMVAYFLHRCDAVHIM